MNTARLSETWVNCKRWSTTRKSVNIRIPKMIKRNYFHKNMKRNTNKAFCKWELLVIRYYSVLCRSTYFLWMGEQEMLRPRRGIRKRKDPSFWLIWFSFHWNRSVLEWASVVNDFLGRFTWLYNGRRLVWLLGTVGVTIISDKRNWKKN